MLKAPGNFFQNSSRDTTFLKLKRLTLLHFEKKTFATMTVLKVFLPGSCAGFYMTVSVEP